MKVTINFSGIEFTHTQFSWIKFMMTRQHCSTLLRYPGTGEYNKFYEEGAYECAGLHFTNLRQSSTLDADGQLSTRDFLVP